MNKKIKNASPCIFNDIKFKSKLEKDSYILLSNLGFSPLYESRKFYLTSFTKCDIPCYSKETLSEHAKRVKEQGNCPTGLSLDSQILRDITYTPDFYFLYNNTNVYIEIKGFQNDVYPYKKKLFRQYLNNKWLEGQKSIFFEINSLYQLKQAIEIIKKL